MSRSVIICSGQQQIAQAQSGLHGVVEICLTDTITLHVLLSASTRIAFLTNHKGANISCKGHKSSGRLNKIYRNIATTLSYALLGSGMNLSPPPVQISVCAANCQPASATPVN